MYGVGFTDNQINLTAWFAYVVDRISSGSDSINSIRAITDIIIWLFLDKFQKISLTQTMDVKSN